MVILRAIGRYDDLLAHAKRVLRPLDFRRAWFRELQRYYRHLTPQEFWVRYTIEREKAAALETANDPGLWKGTDYYILRQMYFRRNDSYYRVLATLPQRGRLIEFGAGVGPVTAWARRYRPDATYTLLDVDSRTLDFAGWRFPWPAAHVARVYADDIGLGIPPADVVTALDVLEHCPNPFQTVRQLLRVIKPGGYLHFNFVPVGDTRDGANLATAQTRKAALDMIEARMHRIVPLPNAIYRKLAVLPL